MHGKILATMLRKDPISYILFHSTLQNASWDFFSCNDSSGFLSRFEYQTSLRGLVQTSLSTHLNTLCEVSLHWWTLNVVHPKKEGWALNL